MIRKLLQYSTNWCTCSLKLWCIGFLTGVSVRPNMDTERIAQRRMHLQMPLVTIWHTYDLCFVLIPFMIWDCFISWLVKLICGSTSESDLSGSILLLEWACTLGIYLWPTADKRRLRDPEKMLNGSLPFRRLSSSISLAEWERTLGHFFISPNLSIWD